MIELYETKIKYLRYFPSKKYLLQTSSIFGQFIPLCFYDNENPLTVLSESYVVNCLPICAP